MMTIADLRLLISLGEAFQFWNSNPAMVHRPEPLRQIYRDHLTLLQHACRNLATPITASIVAGYVSTSSTCLPPQMSVSMSAIRSAVLAELENRYAAVIDPKANSFGVFADPDTNTAIVGEDVKRLLRACSSLPDTYSDAYSACACFMFQFHTPAVFYLMRVAERGLQSLAGHFKLDVGQSGWDGVIKKIQSRISELDKCHPEGWEVHRVFFSELVVSLQGIKNAWRNRAMHLGDDFSEDEARRILPAVESLLIQLSSPPEGIQWLAQSAPSR